MTSDDDLCFSNSLTDLVHRIKAEHEAYGAAAKKGIEHAMAAGALLVEAKGQVKHGQWLPFLRACGVSERTAQLHMRLARNRETIEDKYESVADLTLRSAAALLAPEPVDADDDAMPDALWPGEVWLDIAGVMVRRELYPRSEIPDEVIERYTHFVDDVPAIEVNQRNELIDGFLRLKAAERIGRKRIRAFVTDVANDMQHHVIAIYRNCHGKRGLQLPLHSSPRTLPDGTRTTAKGEIELRDDRRKKLAMETAGQPAEQRRPWHAKPDVGVPDVALNFGADRVTT
jgi:hypothetical protein